MLFRNRIDAGRRLADELKARHIERPVVLGIPRGGVPVASEVADALHGDLGVVVARKLGAPGQPELAIGAVTADGSLFLNERIARETGADDRYIELEKARKMAEAREREETFDGHRRPPLAGRTVIVIDDGLATGATAIAALRSVRNAGAARVILAVPVAPPETLRTISQEADEIVCVSVEPELFAIGQFYIDFSPVVSADVLATLRQFESEHAAPRGDPRATMVLRDGLRLATILSIPAGDGPFPAVIFVHGLGSGKDSPRNVAIAANLLDQGIATVLFDLNGHGESASDPRGTDAFVDDLRAIWQWAITQPAIDPDRIGISGSSMGGVVALDALRRHLIAPRTMVLRAPPIAAGEIEGVNLPVLIVVGSRDPLLWGIQAATSGHHTIHVETVAGASHLFDEPGTLEAARSLTVGWFGRRLAARGEPVARG